MSRVSVAYGCIGQSSGALFRHLSERMWQPGAFAAADSSRSGKRADEASTGSSVPQPSVCRDLLQQGRRRAAQLLINQHIRCWQGSCLPKLSQGSTLGTIVARHTDPKQGSIRHCDIESIAARRKDAELFGRVPQRVHRGQSEDKRDRSKKVTGCSRGMQLQLREQCNEACKVSR